MPFAAIFDSSLRPHPRVNLTLKSSKFFVWVLRWASRRCRQALLQQRLRHVALHVTLFHRHGSLCSIHCLPLHCARHLHSAFATTTFVAPMPRRQSTSQNKLLSNFHSPCVAARQSRASAGAHSTTQSGTSCCGVVGAPASLDVNCVHSLFIEAATINAVSLMTILLHERLRTSSGWGRSKGVRGRTGRTRRLQGFRRGTPPGSARSGRWRFVRLTSKRW